MTTINIAYSGAPLAPSQKSELVSRVTEAFVMEEVGRDSPAIRRGFMTSFTHLGDDDLWLGEQRACDVHRGHRCIQLTVRVMAGPWNAAMKSALFAKVEDILREVADMPRQGTGDDIWMTFVEVPEGAWGLGGRPVSISQIAPVFDEDRRARISAYLAGLPAPGD